MGRPPRISRDQILDAARAVFTARGFEGTTLAEVGKRLGVTPAAILRHFPTKQELFMSAMTGGVVSPPFLGELAETDAHEDPRVVLRHFAEQAVPFVRRVVGTAIAVQMHLASKTTLALPFGVEDEQSPPRLALRTITDYFRRAIAAGVIRGRNPRALALFFMGQLQSYVFMHEVLNVSPAIPLDAYLDALFDLWVDGAIVRRAAGGTRARKQAKAPREDRPRGGDPRHRDRDVAVDARAASAETARSRRNAGGADGERGVARRRPRDPRPRR